MAKITVARFLTAWDRFRYRFLRRLKNRLKPLLRLNELWTWEGESCERCGSCFKLAYDLEDPTWNELYGSDGGCLCLNCAIEKGIENGVFLTPKDFVWVFLFYGDYHNEYPTLFGTKPWKC